MYFDLLICFYRETAPVSLVPYLIRNTEKTGLQVVIARNRAKVPYHLQSVQR